MAEIIDRNGDEVVLQVRVKLRGSLLEMEEGIQQAVNKVGMAATGEALSRFDTTGGKIQVGNVRLSTKGKVKKIYETPYGAVEVQRHVYQSCEGGGTYCPLDDKARIITHSTPLLAKIISSKYARGGALDVVEDLKVSNGRTVVRSFVQNLVEMVGSIAQATEEDWSYEIPEPEDDVATVGLSLDGTCIGMQVGGWREAMTGTLSLYNEDGERQHTIYLGASPEYGKAKFLKRLEDEITKLKRIYPHANYVGIADGAKVNWEFLEKHTQHQVLDFYHATEYLAKVAKAIDSPTEHARKAWLKDACHRLKHDKGSATALLEEMKALPENGLSSDALAGLQSAITYFSNQKHRMNYQQYAALSFPIGSGVTEAACKTLVKQRLCQSGMRWKEKGASIVLALRALVFTKGRFEQFWNRIDQTGLAGII